MGNVVQEALWEGTRPKGSGTGSSSAVVASTSMGRRLLPAWPLAVVLLASVPPGAWGCIICDPAVVAGLRDLEHNYLPSHMSVDAQALQTLVKRLEETVRQFSDLPFNKNSYQGVVDEPTLDKASRAFLKELKRIQDSDLKGNSLLNELTWMMKTQKKNFARLVAEFQRESFCPNDCGVMLQTLIWCLSCEKNMHSCQKSYSCGEQAVQVIEKGDLILDCELSWHKKAEGLTTYSFFKILTNGTEVLLSRGKDSALTKPMVAFEDGGSYRCILDTIRKHSPATIIVYRVQVIPDGKKEPDTTTDSGQRPNPTTTTPSSTSKISVHSTLVVGPRPIPTSTPRPTLTSTPRPTLTSTPKRTFQTHKPHSTVKQEDVGTSTPWKKETPTYTRVTEAGSEVASRPWQEHGDGIANTSQNASSTLSITLIGLVAGGAIVVLGSLALTLYCARRAGLDLGRKKKQCTGNQCYWTTQSGPGKSENSLLLGK
uniref:Izumo sperm-egg fusion protein 1-like n=1 Tax=Monodelphis domestica TaxID=13616 RepID=A0A5F8GDG0_MONDO